MRAAFSAAGAYAGNPAPGLQGQDTRRGVLVSEKNAGAGRCGNLRP